MSVDRGDLRFAESVARMFAFLRDAGFDEIESVPTLVRYRCGDLVVNIYHGRHSYELGFEIGHENELFAMSELIRTHDAALADSYRNPVATTQAELVSGLQLLVDLIRQYGDRALDNNPSFFELLRRQRKSWSEQYALDVLTEQVRPKAEAAFREGRYKEAAELYARIRERLSAAELKKLDVAMKRSGF